MVFYNIWKKLFGSGLPDPILDIDGDQTSEHTNTPTQVEGRSKPPLARLKAPEIKTFSGRSDTWTNWKLHTVCALSSTGYDPVLRSKEYADTHEAANQTVFSQLASATCEGTAQHLVVQHEDNRDGHAAWQSLLTWFESKDSLSEQASRLRSALDSNRLIKGGDVDSYLNKFQKNIRELGKITGEGLSDVHAVEKLLNGMEDPEYDQVKSLLQSMSVKTIEECIVSIHRRAMEVKRLKRKRKEMKNYARRTNKKSKHGDSEGNDVIEHKSRRTGGKSSGDAKLPSVIKLNRNNKIILDNRTCFKLTEKNQKFIKDFNYKTRDTPVSDIPSPDGTTVKPFE